MLRAIACLLLMPLASVAGDWPQFLGPDRDGRSMETGLIKTWPAEGPPRLWQRDVGEGYAGPVVSGDRLILFHRVGDEEVVECLDAKTGKTLWKSASPCDYVDRYGKGNGPRATPSIAGDRVVTYGADGVMSCFELATGKRLWQRPLAAEYKTPPTFFGIGSSPLVWDDRVLLNVGGKEAGIVALSLTDGKEQWRSTRDGASYASPIAVRVGGQSRAVFFTREGIVALDPRTGDVAFQKRWRARYDASVNAATPLLLSGDRLFVSSSYETGAILLKLKADGADVVWTDDEAMSNHFNTCVVHDGRLFGCDGRQEAGARLRCVDPAGPKVLWTKERFGCAALILAGDVVYAATEHGDLVAFAAVPGEYRELARAKILDGAPVRAHPALADGVLFARDGRTLIALDLKSR